MATKFELVDTIYGQFFTLEGDLVSRQLKQFSAHSRNEIAMLLSFVREADIIFDVGAHIGTFAIPLARRLGLDGRVYAFEPQTLIYELFLTNVRLNQLQEKIRVFNGLISDRQESFQPIDDRLGNSMANQFLPVEGAEPKESESSAESPTVYTVDQLIHEGLLPEKANVIKIDTEGAELKVLRSFTNLIDKNLPIIYGEINSAALAQFQTSPAEIEEFLSRWGYHFFRNVGERNSNHDRFSLIRLECLRDGGPFFDFVAVHPSSDRYPLEVPILSPMAAMERQQPERALAEGRLMDAIALYERCIEIEPEERSHYWKLGTAFLLAGREVEAQGTWFGVLVEAPPAEAASWTLELHEVLLQMGAMLIRVKQLPGASRSLHQALELDVPAERAAAAHRYLGILSQLQGNLQGAAASFQQAIALRPDFADAYKNLESIRQQSRPHPTVKGEKKSYGIVSKKQAIVFLAWGERYLQEVESCIERSTLLANRDVVLITDASTNVAALSGNFAKVIKAPFVTKGLLRKTELVNFLPEDYDTYLFLDSDTLVLEDLSLGFEKAEKFEIAVSPAPHYSLDYFWGFDKIMALEGVPCKGQLQYNTGVIFFKNSPKVKSIFQRWRNLAEKYREFTNDQPFFTLAMEELEFNPYTLSISYNYRGYGDAISGIVRVWHSHGEAPENINDFESAWPPRKALPGRVIFPEPKAAN